MCLFLCLFVIHFVAASSERKGKWKKPSNPTLKLLACWCYDRNWPFLIKKTNNNINSLMGVNFKLSETMMIQQIHFYEISTSSNSWP